MKKIIKQKLLRLEIKLLNSAFFNVLVALGLPVGLLSLLGQVI
jgi:hypothetical protein